MKIVRIIARLNIGGPAIHVVVLTCGLRDRGHDSHLLAGLVPSTEGDMEYYAAAHKVTPKHIAELVRPLSPWKDLVAFLKIYRFLRRERPDVVHTHTSKAGTLGRLAAILTGTPAILHTFHGSVFDGYFSPARTRLFLFIERFLARFTDRVITVSESLKEQLTELYRIAPLNKIEVVPLGFDLTDFTNVARAVSEHSKAGAAMQPTIGWVGRFTEIKDPLLFIELAYALKNIGLPGKFMMVGDGPLRSAVEEAILRRGLSADFVLTGWKRNMAEMYSNMDLIVSTSLNEGTPVTIIEAMATGCPFVAPNVGGLVDLTEGEPQRGEDLEEYGNGILVTQRGVDALQRAVLRLVSDEALRSRMGQVGRAVARGRFGQDRLVRETEMIYKRLLGPRAVPQNSTKGDRTKNAECA